MWRFFGLSFLGQVLEKGFCASAQMDTPPVRPSLRRMDSPCQLELLEEGFQDHVPASEVRNFMKLLLEATTDTRPGLDFYTCPILPLVDTSRQ